MSAHQVAASSMKVQSRPTGPLLSQSSETMGTPRYSIPNASCIGPSSRRQMVAISQTTAAPTATASQALLK